MGGVAGRGVYFSSGRRSRKAHNLARNRRSVVCTDRADEAVVVEGVAALIGDARRLRQIAAVYVAKYASSGWRPICAGFHDPDATLATVAAQSRLRARYRGA